MKTVLIADDHAFTSSGMKAALEAVGGLEVVKIVSNGIEAIAAIKRLKPDCAVVDLAMPGANGIEVTIEGLRWAPQTRFVVVTGTSAARIFRELIDVGASGLFLKSMPPEEICRGIARVAHGETVICDAAQLILAELDDSAGLTARETEVLHGIARGMSNAGISDHLGVSIKTVESHRGNLMRKLGVNSTATLLVRAVRDGLVDVSPESDHTFRSPNPSEE